MYPSRKSSFSYRQRAYTNRFARLVVELSHIGTIQDVARFLHILLGYIERYPETLSVTTLWESEPKWFGVAFTSSQ